MNPQNRNESNDYNLPPQGGRVVDDSQTVQSYASGASDSYRLESLENALEVHSEQQPIQSAYVQPKKRFRFSGFFSRRKAMIVSTLITALVLLITVGAMAFLVRKGPGDKQNSQATTQQDVKIEDTDNSKIPSELQGAQQSLLVSGDIITRGSLKISDGGYVTIIRVQNPGANQTVTLPGTSGTICLSTNNCGYASQEAADGLQGQLSDLQSQVSNLNDLVNALSQVTIPPAGVTELNGQTGSVSIQGSTNRISVSTSNGIVTVTTPQDLDSNANVQFGNLSLSMSGQVRANTLIQTAAGNNVSINAGNDSITFVAGGRVFSLPTTGGASQAICTTGATCATGSGTAVILSPGTAQIDGTANSSIFINQTGGGSLIQMQSGGTDRFTVSNAGDTTIGGSLTVSGLGNGFVRSTGGTLGVVTAINLTSEVTGVLPIANGGTGANNAAGARTNIGAAASGANSDITSTTALNTITPGAALTVGTPTQQFTLQGASNSSISAGSGANITTLAFAAPSGTNTITFPALTGTVCVSTGNCAAAGTAGGDLTGTYPNPTIARLQGANLNISSSSNGQILIYNSANTRWENASVSGDVTISGLGVVTIANNAVTTSKIADNNVTTSKIADSNITTAKIADGNVTNAKLQNSSLTVTSGGGLLNGGAVSLGSSITLNIGQGDGITVNADDIAVDNTVCRTSGNCAGVGGVGDISGTGSNGRIALFNGAKTLTSSTLLQSAGALTLDTGNNFVLTSGNLVLSNGNVDVTGGGNFSGTVSGADATQNDEFVTLSQLNAAIGGVGGGVDSLNTLAGDLSLQGTAGQITISSNGTDTLTLSLNTAVTLQGNTFNGVNQLVRLGASGELPVLNAANLTDLNASNLASGTVPSARLTGSYTGITGLGTVTTGTWNGNALADAYVQDNITISSSGTVDWTALNNYPAACGAGQAITQLGDVPTCQTFAAGSGSGNYIQNQNASAQVANFWINGQGTVSSLTAPTIQTETINETSIGAAIEIQNGTGDIILAAAGDIQFTAGEISASGNITASSFTGDGSALSNLNASNLTTGTLSVARIANSSITNAKLQNSSLTVTAGGGLINGGSIALGGTATLNIGQGDGITVNADDIAVDNTVCRTNGTNCPVITGGSGGIGDITGNGTANRLAVFDAAKNIVNSYLLQSAGTLTLDNGVDLVLAGGDINVTGAGTFTGTVSGANAVNNNEFVTLSQLNAAIGGVGGGVSSLNTLSGDLDLQGTAGQITVSDNGSDTITLALHANVTLQGNTFNGPDQLVQLNNSGELPVLDGSNLTNVNAALLQGQNGAYYLDLGNATGTLNIARIADGSITNVKLANSAVTVTAGNGLTDGGSVSLGGTTTLNIGAGDGITVNANDVAVDATVARLNANANFTANLQQGGNNVCTTAGNCAGVGGVGDISGTGSNGRIALFNGTKTLTSSTLLQSAGTLTLDTGNNLVLTAGNLTLSSGDIGVTGNGTFSGTLTASSFIGSGASLTSLSANEITSGTIASARLSGSYTGITGVGTVTVGTWNGTAISDAYVQDNITISSSGTVDWTALNNYPAACAAGNAITALGDTVTCSPFTTGGSGVTTVGAIDSQTKSANGAVISGSTIFLQTADASNPGLVSSGNQTFGGNKTFNGSVVLAASQSLTITGGNTASRPGSPTEGMLYFDTDTKQLLVYANGKWQADRSTSTKIVGTSATGGASSAAPSVGYDGADYVNTSTTSAQTVINSALTAVGATGGTVYLMEGTYVIDGQINIPNNVTLTGAGTGTVIKLKNSSGTTNMITNTDTSTGVGVRVSNLKIDGNQLNNGSGTIRGMYFSGMGNTASRSGVTVTNVTVVETRQAGIYFNSSVNSVVSSSNFVNASGTAEAAIMISGSSYVSATGNAITGTGTNGIRLDTSAAYNTVSGNAISVTGGTGIYFSSTNNNTIANNTINVTGTYGMFVATATYTNFIGNIITGGSFGFRVQGGGNNIFNGNTIYDSGAASANDAFYLTTSTNNNTITNNTIADSSCSGTCYAINVNSGTSNYIADNNLGNGTINDAGTNTVFGGQTTTSTTGNYQIQPAGSATIELMKGTNVTGALNVTGNFDTNGSLTVGNANQFVISNTGVVTSGTWNGTALVDAYVSDTLTISNAGTVDWQALSNYPAACGAGQAITQLGDSITCIAFAAGTGSGNYIQNQNASQQTTSNFWISGTGRADTSFTTPLLDTATAVALNIGTTNATQINLNKNVVVAASQSLTITGGNTASRPGAPTEGMVYFDTDTDRLLVYSNGKWQADRSDAVLVAASDSSQADKDAADYVANGNTGAAADGDQVEINQALTAGAGKKVVLLAGTYTIDASVSVPNNTTLTGVGANTLVTIQNTFNTSIDAITNTTTGGSGTGIVIQNLRLDGNVSNQSSGTMRGIYLNGVGSGNTGTAIQGAKVMDLWVNNWRTSNISLNSTANSYVSGVSMKNAVSGSVVSLVIDGTSINNTFTDNEILGGTHGIYIVTSTSSNNTFTSNIVDSANNKGIYVSSGYNTFTGNTVRNVNGDGFFLETSTASNNNISGNTIQSNNEGIHTTGGAAQNLISGNNIASNTVYGIELNGGSANIISSNKFYSNGGNGTNNSIYIPNSSSNTIASNSINDTSATTNNYGINIGVSASSNYIADNTLGGSSINDASATTIYAGQVNSSTNYVVQPAGTVELMKNTNVTGTLNITSDVDTNGSLTVGNANQFVISNTGVVTSGTWNGTAVVDTYVSNTLTIDNTGTVDWQALSNYPSACPAGQAITQLGDSITCTAFAAGTGSGNYIQNQNSGQQTTSNFWISGTGRADTSFTTPLLDTATAVALNIGTTNATQINLNKNVVVAASQSLTITGGNTASRPGAPTEGMVYFDTDTDRLLVYSNGKWQADRSDAVLVAASNSSQADRDAADYVANGNTGVAADGDQVEINQALTAADPVSGTRKTGKVYLFAGTYTVDASISMPNNTTLAGAGNGTLITIPNSFNASLNTIVNTDTTNGSGITIQDLRLDGNKSNQSSNFMTAVSLDTVGYAASTDGPRVSNLTITNWRGDGIYGYQVVNGVISGNIVRDNVNAAPAANGLRLSWSNNNIVSDNVFWGNNWGAFTDSSPNTTFTGNTFQNSVSTGLEIDYESGNTVTGNTFWGNATYGFRLDGSSENTISGNTFQDSGGAATNNAIAIGGGSGRNTVTGNTVADTSCTTNCYAVWISSGTGNYLADNQIGANGTINDAGTNTIHGGQTNGSGNYVIQPASGSTVELMRNSNVTGTLNVTSNFDTNGSLTVGSANQFVISNTGVVTSGTWQAGTIGLLYGGTNNTSYTTNGIVYSNGTSLVSTGAGTNGQCLIATTGGAPSWTSCTATTLQGAYDASSTAPTPADITLADNKNIRFIAADTNGASTATDPSIIMKLNCTLCTNATGTGNFIVQNNSSATLFAVAGNGDIQIGTTTNGISLISTVNGGAFTLSGSAMNVKRIRLLAEYPSAVLDADLTNNLGTMTSGYENSSSRMNYYKWTTTQATNQDYDIVVQVPVPLDFHSWASSNQVSVSAYTTDATNGTITITALDTNNGAVTNCTNASATPTAGYVSGNVWRAPTTNCQLSNGTYTPGEYITLRIKLQSPTSGDTRVGNIVLNYNSKF